MKTGNSLRIFKWAPHMKGGIMKGKKKYIIEVCRRYTHLGKQNAPLEFINSIVQCCNCRRVKKAGFTTSSSTPVKLLKMSFPVSPNGKMTTLWIFMKVHVIKNWIFQNGAKIKNQKWDPPSAATESPLQNYCSSRHATIICKFCHSKNTF